MVTSERSVQRGPGRVFPSSFPGADSQEAAVSMEWIRTSFPQARTSAPGGAYARIRHPLRAEAAEGALFAGLPADTLFFDLETLGFLGHPIFLVGALRRAPRRHGGPGWEVAQYLARDYSEEEAMLRAFFSDSRGAGRWVSFNGKTFDLPNLRARAAFYGLPAPVPPEHVDLLPRARRIYRKVLPNCRLQTLEAKLFGRYRYRDVPGSEIPAAYHAFVRGGDPELMERILEHNRSDLVSLVRLLAHLDGGEAAA